MVVLVVTSQIMNHEEMAYTPGLHTVQAAAKGTLILLHWSQASNLIIKGFSETCLPSTDVFEQKQRCSDTN